ncbi:MAG: FG-GAP repeat domain-containing protein [Trinickia sp.]
MKSISKHLAQAVTITSVVVLISACGGGGGGNTSTASTSASPSTPASAPAGLLVNYQQPVRSTVTNNFPTPTPSARASSGSLFALQGMRQWQVGNFGENSCPALVNTPTYYDVNPALPMQIFTSDCKGNFTQNTQNVISGAAPTTGFVDAIFAGDFNKTGVDSLMFADQGQELVDCGATPGCAGHDNELLLNQSGKLVNIASAQLNQDDAGGEFNFNHVSTMYNTNVPGGQTAVITRLGGSSVVGFGTALFNNDGNGNFIENNASLPPEVAYTPTSQFNGSIDYVMQGTAALANLDSSGSPYLIVGTYSGGTFLTHQNAVFIYKLVGGVYQTSSRVTIPIPATYATIPYTSGSNLHLGVSSIVVGDFESTGHPDIAVIWEGGGTGTYLQLIHNDGAGNFTDITASANVPNVNIQNSSGVVLADVTRMQAVDINGDGKTELELLLTGGVNLSQWGNWRPVLQFVNGQMQFMDVFNGASVTTIAQQLGVNPNSTPLQPWFGNFGSGKTDLMFLAYGDPTTLGAFTGTTNYNMITLLHK